MRPADLNIEKLKELCTKATAPPWSFRTGSWEIYPEKSKKVLAKAYRHRNSIDYPAEDNCWFIVWTRQELPKLIEYIEELEKPIHKRIVELENELKEKQAEISHLEVLLTPIRNQKLVDAIAGRGINRNSSKEELLAEIYRLNEKLDLRLGMAEEAEKYGATKFVEHKQREEELLERMNPEH